MSRQKPSLLSRRRSLEKSLAEVIAQADKLMAGWDGLEAEGGRAFLTDKLTELARRRTELESGVTEVERALVELDRERVTAGEVRTALGRIR